MLRDSAIYILSRVVPSGLGFITGMALTWLLTPETYGLYGLGLTIVVLVAGIFFDWHGLAFMRFFQANAENPRFMPTVVQTFVLLWSPWSCWSPPRSPASSAPRRRITGC